MRTIYSNRGSISIILLLILVPTLVFSGVMIDISRRHLSKASIEQTGKLTLNSVLADYDTILKDVYGLFAISQHPSLSEPVRSELIMEQFRINMENIILLSPVLEDIQIATIPESNYANPEVIERGILEFMKYRGPAETALSLLDSLEVFTKIGERSRQMEYQMDAELSYKDISADCAELYRIISAYDSHIDMYIQAEKQLEDSISHIARCSDTESEEYITAYNDALKHFHTWKEFSPLDMAEHAISEGNRIRRSVVVQDQASETDGNDGRVTIEQVDGLLEQLHAATTYLKMRNFETVEEYMIEVRNGSSSGSNHNPDQYYYSESAYLKPIGEVVYIGNSVIGVPSLYILLMSAFGSNIGEVGEEYGNGKTLRKGISDINKQAKREASVEEAYAYSMHLFEDVPSGQRYSTPASFEDIDENNRYGAVSQCREMSSKVTDLVSVLESNAKNLRNSLYISDYVMRNFSYLTSTAEQMTMTGVPIDPEHNRIYGCEAEYILFGNKGSAEKKLLWFTVREEAGPESNLATAKTSIFAIRFACNSAFALTDSSIDRMVLAPALAIQAASGGFFPHQLAALTIKLALALVESAVDLDLLVQGERVPLVKSSTTWRCSMQGILEMLKQRVSTEISDFVDEEVQKGVGFLQRCVDDSTEFLDRKINDCVDDISTDIEIAISATIERAVSEIMSVLKDSASRAFSGIFTTGDFDREHFIQSARTEVTEIMGGLESEIFEALSALRPFIENDVVIQLADILESVISESGELVLEEVLCSNITSQLNECISMAMGEIKDELLGEIDKIISLAGNELKDSVKSYGNELSEATAEKLTTTAIDFLNRHIPADLYTMEDIVDLDGTGLSKTRLGRINETILCLSYSDHLQILLMLRLCGADRDEVLLRIADVIQLNVSLSHKRAGAFRMAEAFTAVEISAAMRIPSLLLPTEIADYYENYHDYAIY